MDLKTKINMWLAWHMPKRLVYWCAIRMFTRAHITTYRNLEIGDMDFVKAMTDWEKDM